MIPYHVILIPQYLIFRDLGWLNTLKPLIVPAWFGGGLSLSSYCGSSS